MSTNFQKYLKQKLKEIQLDESVYTEYITSILEDETSEDEKRETLEEVLAGVLVRLEFILTCDRFLSLYFIRSQMLRPLLWKF